MCLSLSFSARVTFFSLERSRVMDKKLPGILSEPSVDHIRGGLRSNAPMMVANPEGHRKALADHSFLFPVVEVGRVYDGDTLIDTVLDLGFGLRLSISCRLYGINAPEVRGTEREAGLRSKEWLATYLNNAIIEAKPIHMQTIQRDGTPAATGKEKGKYGRWLVRLWVGGEDVNDRLVIEGFAEEKSY